MGFQYPLSLYISQAMIHFETQRSSEEISSMKRFQIGVISRVCCGFIFYPLYTLRTKFQMKQLSNDHKHLGIRQLFMKVYRDQGMRRFYSGFGVHALHSGLLNGLFVMIYSKVYKNLQEPIN